MDANTVNMDATGKASELRVLVALLLASAILYAAFAVFTGWTLEDAMIIARVSGNFAVCGLLSFNCTELASSATSPVFALVLGVLAALAIPPLFASKAIGIAATVSTGAVLYYGSRRFLPPPSALFPTTMFLFLPHTVTYSVAGLETPVYTLACASSLFLAVLDRRRASLWVAAGAVILRPDGLIILGFVILLAALGELSRRDVLRLVLGPLLLIGVFYVTHRYFYGVWIPQSVTAKGQVYAVEPIVNLQRYLHRMFLSQPVGLAAYFLAAIGVAFSVRKAKALLWLLAWYVMYHAAFMLRAPLFSWYLQPPMFVVALFAGIGISETQSLFGRAIWGSGSATRRFEYSLLSAVLAICLLASVPYAKNRADAASYDSAVRVKAGKWLATHTDSNDLVFTEALGFVGYNAPNPFVDWPGLASPGVPAMVRGMGRLAGYRTIIYTRKPKHLVLRRPEWDDLKASIPEYKLVAEFHYGPGDGVDYVIASSEKASSNTSMR